jgi:PhnB protein
MILVLAHFLNLIIMAKKSFIPEGYRAITPSLAFKGADAALKWYTNVFGATQKMRLDNADRTIMHAELNIGDSLFFIAEENPKVGNKSAKSVNGNSVQLHVYVPDVDETLKRAIQNGSTLVMAAQDQFYGDRVGSINDPFGYTWILATHIKDVPEKEIYRQMETMSHN